MEWRYEAASYKVIAIDAGHVCQNLYLACETISAGTCAVAAYDQKKTDQLLRVDGDEEFVIYMHHLNFLCFEQLNTKMVNHDDMKQQIFVIDLPGGVSKIVLDPTGKRYYSELQPMTPCS